MVRHTEEEETAGMRERSKLVVVPMAIVTGFFAIDLAADLFAGVSPMHLGLDVVALCVALLGLGGALRRR